MNAVMTLLLALLLITSGCLSYYTEKNTSLEEEEKEEITEQELNEGEEEGNIEQNVNEEEDEEVIDSVFLSESTLPSVEGGISVNVENVTLDGDILSVHVFAEDLFAKDEESPDIDINKRLRDPTIWNGFLYIKNKTHRITFCASQQHANTWETVYCDSLSNFAIDLPEIVYFVYSTEHVDLLGAKNIGTINALDDTYIVKLDLKQTHSEV